MRKSLIYLFAGLMFQSAVANEPEKKRTDYINPIIGASTNNEIGGSTHGLGKTFPGAATPFGMVQLSPDTRTGDDTGPGYSWHHTTIEGFSFIHMSGIGWFGDFGNFLVMPATGELKTAKGADEKPEEGYRSRFRNETEIAKAGYYSVMLDDYNIRTELTAAPKAGFIRFTYPENKKSRVQIDLSRRIGGTSTEQYVEFVDDHTIKGWMKCPPEGGGWGNGKGKADYTVYFYCQFSKPLNNSGVWSVDVPEGMVRLRDEVAGEEFQKLVAQAKVERDIKKKQGKHLGVFLEFNTQEGEQVLLRNGISFVSMEGAQKNLEASINHWDFDKTRLEAEKLWAKTLNKIIVEGGTEEDHIVFNTALYHSFIDPREVNDVDGKYFGIDKKIHQLDGFKYRSIFSGWDVFRSQFPLMTLIDPSMVNDEINSLMQMAEYSGREYYPRWEIMNSYSGCMLGNPAVSVLVDAYAKGIRNYDIEKAYKYAKRSVDVFGNSEKGYTSKSATNPKIKSVSHTLEYAYFEWCVSEMARMLGKEDDALKYFELSKSYQNIWNDEVKWFRGRDVDGSWFRWKGKTKHGQGCKESNPYQQGWFVPHDVQGHMELMGAELFEKELIAFFENVPEDFMWNDYYNHANEPVHHVPFYFNLIKKPWLTQKWTRIICDRAYGTDVLGLVGNEDVGQMSAWYIMSAIGFHPVCPGDTKYQITSPVFSKAIIPLDKQYYGGGVFTVVANNNSPKNIYIQSARLNGKPMNRSWIDHKEIVAGGELYLEMGPEPNKEWGVE
ncbi:GH92 family glycosyl hydrolase [Carboxylicivirga sp. RSCT41]|uniref:GH92 family glycosyl hydrolase n=1 Tax=Carboxylicivirga agarovorans TaxID=3417570 RepID=UPI003D34EDBA